MSRRKWLFFWISFLLFFFLLFIILNILYLARNSFQIKYELIISAIAFSTVLTLILVGLFGAIGSTITRDNILDNINRARIYDLIEQYPGIHISEIIRKLDLGNGQTRWHLECLKKLDMIKVERKGKYLLVFPNFFELYSSIDSDKILALKSKTREKILNAIKEKPKITQKHLKEKLNLSQSTVAYHLSILEYNQLIYHHKKGQLKYYVLKNIIND